MMKTAKVVNVLPQGAGTPYTRRCSILQDGPFSMMVLAIITRPWLLLIKQMDVIPRTLADDLALCLTSAEHPANDEHNMLGTLITAVDSTLEFIHDMGGIPSPNKSATLASAAEHRKKAPNLKVGQYWMLHPSQAQRP